MGLDEIKRLYASDPFFEDIFGKCSNVKGFNDLCLNLGFLFKASPRFVICYCKNHMEVDSWVILDTTRHTPSSQRTTHNKEEMQELGIGQR
jgi:hypothetical protein